MALGQSTGSTSPTATNILKVFYKDGVPSIINKRQPIFGAIKKRGLTMEQFTRQAKWGYLSQRSTQHRWVGADDPSAYALTTGGLDFDQMTITFKKCYGVQRISRETELEAGAKGAMDSVKERVLREFVEGWGFELERLLMTSDGTAGKLFRCVNSETAGSNVTVEVDRYGGFTGWQLGILMESLALKGQQIQWSDGTTVRNTSTADTITTVTKTFGSEALVLATLNANLTAGDYAYPSRIGDSPSTFPTAAVPLGLPVLVDDGTRLATYFGITVSSGANPRHSAHVLSNGGTRRDLTSALLQTATMIGRVRESGGPMAEDGTVKYAFVCHPFQEGNFALGLTEDARYTAPSLFTKKGVKPYAGRDLEEVLHYSGIPFLTSHLHSRNEVEMIDFDNLYWVHCGPEYGQLLEAEGHLLEGAPAKQWVFGAYGEFVMPERAAMVGIRDLTTITSA